MWLNGLVILQNYTNLGVTKKALREVMKGLSHKMTSSASSRIVLSGFSCVSVHPVLNKVHQTQQKYGNLED